MSEAIYFEAPAVTDILAKSIDQAVYDKLEGALDVERADETDEAQAIESIYAGALGGLIRWLWDHADARHDVIGLRDGIMGGVESFLAQLVAQPEEG